MQYISDLDNAILQAHAQERKNLAIMGSTGTIGKNALAIIRNAPELFSITALAGGKNITLLAKQALEFTPPYLAVQEEKYVELLYKALKKSANSSYKPEILYGKIGYAQLASLQEVDIVLSAQVGAAGLRATICAAQHGKTICLANKESLVLAGDYIRQLVQQTKATILPVDSEHYAIFQCLFQNYTSSYINSASPQTFVTKTFAPEIFGNSTQTHSPQNTFLEQNACQKNSRVKRLILTASGGPFRTKSMEFLKSVKKEDALKHPNWSMGAKITIDSATLMNKGLEVIEACHLYGLSMEQIDVLVHPQSIVHSLVEWQDGSMLAQLAVPDMRLPIAACLSWPHMLTTKVNTLSALDLTKTSLHFEHPNTEMFPCLNLAKKAYKEKKCIELNAANEIAVELFLEDKISFTQIPEIVKHTMETASPMSISVDIPYTDVLTYIEDRDEKARIFAYTLACL